MFEALKEKRKIRNRDKQLEKWSNAIETNPTTTLILEILSNKEALEYIHEKRYADELIQWEYKALLDLPELIANTPFTLEEVKQIDQNKEDYFAGYIVANEKLPAEAYVFLSEGADFETRSLLAENQGMPVEILASYVEKALAELRHKHHSCSHDYMGINLAANPSVPLPLLRKLGALHFPAESPEWIKEMKTAGTPVVNKQSNTSRAIWLRLSHNPSYTFRSAGWRKPKK